MELVVVQNAGMESEVIYYTGHSEIDAYKRYYEEKKKKAGKLNIFLATVKREKFIFGHDIIDSYQVHEVIK